MENDAELNAIKCEVSCPVYDNDITQKTGALPMIEQTARVVSIDSGYAWIIPQTSQSCGGCTSKSGCGTVGSAFNFFKSHHEPQKMRVLNTLYVRPGDTVVVGMQGNALLLYSLLAYLLPLVSLLVFAILGREVFTYLALGADIGAILGGVTGLLGGLKLANVISQHSLAADDFQPVILRVQEQPIFGLPNI